MSNEKTQKIKGREERHDNYEEYRRLRRRQWVGIFAGAGLGMMIGSLIPWVRVNVELPTLILWSAALGGMLAGIQRFEAAGQILTRSENRMLNFAVGVGIPVLILLGVSWAVSAL